MSLAQLLITLSSGQRTNAQNKSNGTHRHKRQTYSGGFFLFSISQVQKLKAASKESVLTKDKIHGIMSVRSPSVKPREPQLTIAVSKVERYFPKGFSSEQMESTILKLLENYYRKRQDYER